MCVLIKYFECDRAVVFSCSIQNIQNLNLSIQNVKLFILRQAHIVSKSEVWQLPSPFLWKFSLISSFALSFCKIKVVCIIIQILYIDLVTSIMQKKKRENNTIMQWNNKIGQIYLPCDWVYTILLQEWDNVPKIINIIWPIAYIWFFNGCAMKYSLRILKWSM